MTCYYNLEGIKIAGKRNDEDLRLRWNGCRGARRGWLVSQLEGRTS
jgi:hypothetical protein